MDGHGRSEPSMIEMVDLQNQIVANQSNKTLQWQKRKKKRQALGYAQTQIYAKNKSSLCAAPAHTSQATGGDE